MGVRLRFPDPPLDWIPRLARALAGGRILDRRILERLMARPAAYGELKPLLAGKGDNNLTQALRRLRRDGLVRTRTDVYADTPLDQYEATEVGVATWAALIREETLRELSAAIQAAHPAPASG